jgi:hypothetical protein
MGVHPIDKYTFMHFICGYFVTSTLLPTYPLTSLSITNIIHLITELIIENEIITDTGQQIESTINHTTDIIAFFIGSLLGVLYGCPFYAQKENIQQRIIVFSIMILITIQEVMRELLPRTWPISAAFNPYSVFGYKVPWI